MAVQQRGFQGETESESEAFRRTKGLMEGEGCAMGARGLGFQNEKAD